VARRDQAGTGLLSTVFGLGIVMATLAVAVDVSLGLWSRSRIESIAYDAARSVATAPSGTDVPAARQQAIERACKLIGPDCGGVHLTFESVPLSPAVVLRVVAPDSAFVPGVDRRIRIQREVR